MPPENDEVSPRHDVATRSLSGGNAESTPRDMDSSFSLVSPSSERNVQAINAIQTSSNRSVTTDDRSHNENCDREEEQDSAHEVFRASLNFENAHPPVPFPIAMEERRSSSQSLYPTLESVSQAANPDSEIDECWENSARSNDDGRHVDAASTQFNAIIQTARQSQFDLSRTEEVREGLDGGQNVVMVETVGVVVENSLRAEVLDSSIDSSGIAALPPKEEEKGEVCNFDEGQNAPAYAMMPRDDAATEDDDLVALKLAAAYGGNYAGGVAIARTRDQEAESTVVEYDVHPSNVAEDAVHAEFLGVDYSTPTEQVVPPVTPAAATPQDVYELMERDVEEATEATVIESGPMVEKTTSEPWSSSLTEEARVLPDNASGAVVDLDRKLPATSDVHTWTSLNQRSADGVIAQNEGAEAEVVEITEEVHPSEVSNDATRAELIGTDFRCAIAVPSTPQQEPMYLEDGGTDGATCLENEAEVLGITEEILPAGGHQAELIHSEFSCAIAVSSGSQQELTIPEDGRLEDLTLSNNEAEVVGITERGLTADSTRVEFIQTDSSCAVAIPSSSNQEMVNLEESGTAGMAFIGEEAEVLGITEDVHPVEASEGGARAELIRPDFDCAVAVPSASHQDSSDRTIEEGGIEGTVIISEENSSALAGVSIQAPSAELNEVQATLVLEENLDGRHPSGSTEVHTPVTAFVEESSNNRTVSFSKDPPTSVATVVEETSTQSLAAIPVSEATPSVSVGTEASSTDTFERGPSDSTLISGDIPAAHNGLVRLECMNSPSLSSRAHSVPSIAVLPPVAPVLVTEVSDNEISERSAEPPIPRPASPVVTNSSTSWASCRSDGSNSQRGLHALSNNIARSTNSVMEMLFGESKPNLRPRPPAGFDIDSYSGSILPRTLLPSSVIYSEATNSWVATVNTNQKALDCNNVEESSKSLRAFSVPTKQQAICLARAWAPPRMHPFPSNPVCFICEAKFAVFRRASHCRNCGVCVCSSCSVQWPSKMLPATYKNSRASLNICKACDWLCSAFRLALLQGDHDKAVALNATGNLNLTTPFANVKGELFYPVHCAVLGGNLELLKWLVDEHCCPLRSIRISNGRQRDSSGSYTPILTSKGRSLLGIALGNRNIDIVRYLVVEKRMLLSAENDLSIDTLVQNLDLVLRALPEEVLRGQTFGQQPGERPCVPDNSRGYESAQSLNSAVAGCCEAQGAVESKDSPDFTSINARQSEQGDEASEASIDDACIICFSNTINCVATPCGHQVCCLECSNNISRCPVCAAECSFMRVFKP